MELANVGDLIRSKQLPHERLRMFTSIQIGNAAGWIHYIDCSEAGYIWNDDLYDRYIARLKSLIVPLKYICVTTFRPRKIFPGYFSQTKLVVNNEWYKPSVGTTPQNISIWNDLINSNQVYYQTNTSYVDADYGSPERAAISTVHEMFHQLMPLSYSNHNDQLGTAFSQYPPDNATVTELAATQLGSNLYLIRGGNRLCNNIWVNIPHLVSEDAPGKIANGPRYSGKVKRYADGWEFDNINYNWIKPVV